MFKPTFKAYIAPVSKVRDIDYEASFLATGDGSIPSLGEGGDGWGDELWS